MIYLFNSTSFILFFLAVFSLYWLLPQKFRNPLLLAASYLFYASWSWKFLLLLIFSSMTNYFLGLKICVAEGKKRKFYLILGIMANLSILGFFKYYNFFAENLIALLNPLGLGINLTTLNIILPIGISFYTFQAMGYIIDVYRKEIAPTKKILDFSLFIAYFPQLIAGPIERASRLIPKIQAVKKFREINYREGTYLFVYGLFKKVVIADSAAVIVDKIYSLSDPTGAQVVIAAYAFAVQLYADFSGYTDMARGISRFFGIELSRNFNLPYLARNPSDFWRRWHITLSTWVRDYIYKPLGGRRSRFYGLFALLIAWLLMGLWHGASWNFVLWGLYWFALIVVYRAARNVFGNSQLITALKEKTIAKVMSILLMFHLTVYGWVIFRAENIGQAAGFTKSIFSGIALSGLFSPSYLFLYAAIVFLLVYELLQYTANDELFISKKGFYYQMAFYLVLFFLFVEIGAITNVEFIYFQF